MSFFSKKQLIILLLGFSSGLPLALTGGTFQAWLTEDGIDIKTLGYLSVIGIPYTYKFLWAPALDFVSVLPIGKRKGWILLCQFLLILLFLCIGAFSPSSQLNVVLVFALLIAFFSATQDIAIDAYRREILKDEELGAGAANSQLGYRLGMIVSSGFALILADSYSWRVVYSIMSGIMLIGVATLFFADESREHKTLAPKLTDFIVPFKEFFSRQHWFELLLLVFLFKITDAFAMALTTRFLLDLSFTKTEIGSVLKVVGVTATIVGSLVAFWCMTKISLRSALIYFGIAQLLANLAYYGLSIVGHDLNVFTLAVIVENFGSGLGTAAYVAFLMAITKKEFSAAQYALFTGVAHFSRLAVQVPSGVIAVEIGWSNYFILSGLLGLPAVLLVILRFNSWKLAKVT